MNYLKETDLEYLFFPRVNVELRSVSALFQFFLAVGLLTFGIAALISSSAFVVVFFFSADVCSVAAAT